MSKENNCNCEFCKLNALRAKALESDDIEFVKKTLEEFADLWLCVDEDLNYYKCILDGNWLSAEQILRRSLAKVRKLNNRCVLCGGEYEIGKGSQICNVCRYIIVEVNKENS